MQGALGEVLLALGRYRSVSSTAGSVLWQKGVNGSESSTTKGKGIQKVEQAYKQDVAEL